MSPSIFLFYFLALNLVIIPPSRGTTDRPSFVCLQNISCGSIENVGFPFWGLDRPSICGSPELQLFCDHKSNPYLIIETNPYNVLQVNSSDRTMTLAQDGFLFTNTTCPPIPLNTTLNSSLFSFNNLNDVVNVTILYQCPSDAIHTNNSELISSFTCNSSNALAYYGDGRSDHGCRTRVEVPVFSRALERLKKNETTLLGVLNEGFRVEYVMDADACAACVGSGGACGSAAEIPTNFACYCPDGVASAYPYRCPGKSDKTKIGIGVAIGSLGSVMIIGASCFVCIRRYKKQLKHGSSTNTIDQQSRIIPSSPYTLSDLENGDNYFGVNLFSYDELEEATNHFSPSKELGDGGFGTVYHANLGDGREVAIKRLYENNTKRVQQFMNEIEILARLRHKNLVSLYGYSSQQSRELLLVYEYISNGTVADHLHGTKRSIMQNEYVFSPLPWHTRLSIAIETASALVYLHASDIIHRDVKTNNILLDNNFSVKVADFGLSRLFPLDVTHVSTSPQGTPGYVDPEYHQCYHLTDKSDVYSFGVVLVELVSSKPAVDITRHRHEINLSNLAIHKIQNGLLHELVDSRLGFDSDSKVNNEVTRVAELAFQCLQHDREMRPTMEDVLETLTSIRQDIKIERIGDVLDIPVDEIFRLKSDLLMVSSPESNGAASTSQSS